MSRLLMEVCAMSIRSWPLIIGVLILRSFVSRKVSCIGWIAVAATLLLPITIPVSISLPEVDTSAPVTVIAQAAQQYYLIPQAMSQAVPGDRSDVTLALLVCFWLAGVAVILGWGIFRWGKLRCSTREAVREQKNVYRCGTIDYAFACGWMKPRIYLPRGLPEEEEAFVLAHEQAHLRRLDPARKTVFYVALAIHWFDPLVWAAWICFGRDMELACDEVVTKSLDLQERKAYAKALLSQSTEKRMMPLSFSFGDIQQRIRAVMRGKRPSVFLSAVSLIILGCLLAVSMTGQDRFGDVVYLHEQSGNSSSLSGLREGSSGSCGIESTDGHAVQALSYRILSVEPKEVVMEFTSPVTDKAGKSVSRLTFSPGEKKSVYLQTGDQARKYTLQLLSRDPEASWNWGLSFREDRNLYAPVFDTLYILNGENVPGKSYVILQKDGSFVAGESISYSFSLHGHWEQVGGLLYCYPDNGPKLCFQVNENALVFRLEYSQDSLWFADKAILTMPG